VPRPRPAAEEPLGPEDIQAVFTPLADARTLLAAVSGGPDSVALMGALAGWAKAAPGGPAVTVATVDHRLRDGSASEAAAVAAAAHRLGLPHATLPWTDRRGPAGQDAARRARYRLLCAHAETVGADVLLTAHTLDDQAETVLMRMAAGTGLSGLAGMAPSVRRGPLRHLRPFLPIPKSRLVATCRAQGWDYVSDPSNADPRFARARWRELAPALAAEGLDAARLSGLAIRAARADAALAAVAAEEFSRSVRVGQGGAVIADGDALLRRPDEIGLRVLLLALTAVRPSEDGAAPFRLERLEACWAALVASRSAGQPLRRTLSGCLVALDRSGRLAISPEPTRRRGRPRPLRSPVTNDLRTSPP
jgi:tRNA(Ile)-lysidine synthase